MVFSAWIKSCNTMLKCLYVTCILFRDIREPWNEAFTLNTF